MLQIMALAGVGAHQQLVQMELKLLVVMEGLARLLRFQARLLLTLVEAVGVLMVAVLRVQAVQVEVEQVELEQHPELPVMMEFLEQ
jgi:hypothetical protein